MPLAEPVRAHQRTVRISAARTCAGKRTVDTRVGTANVSFSRD